jgi:ATP/maltotriose-dependent transcriptional regulator MalT
VISRQAPASADPFESIVAQAEADVRDHETAEARRQLGGLYYVDDRFDDAQQQWEIAFRLFRADGNNRAAARTAIDIAGIHTNVHGHVAAGGGWVERARMLLERVGPCVEWGYFELATIACARMDIDQLLASAERALQIALEYNDPDLEAEALADGGLALVTKGQTAEGMARLDAALAAISAGEVSPTAAGMCYCSMLSACDRAGDVRRAQEWSGMANDLVRAGGDRPRVLHTHCRLAYGSVLLAAGRWPEAEALMVEALGPVESPAKLHRDLTLAHLAELRIEQGRIEEAAELLAPFEDRIHSCAPLANIHLRRDQPDLAAAVLRRGLSELHGDSLRIAPLLASLVVAELQRGDVGAAGEAADRLDEIAAGVDLATIRADAHLARARVLGAAGDDAAAIASFERALAGLARISAPCWRGPFGTRWRRCCHVRGSRRWRSPRRGPRWPVSSGSAQRSDATGRRPVAQSRRRGRTRPQRADDLTGALSVREQEVLDLVRQGLSNAEIASRLFISPKTAEHHVSRILTKLGVRSRGEAAAMAVRLAATSDS